jgi:hypothetical protein
VVTSVRRSGTIQAGVWFCFQGDGHHFTCCRHFKIQWHINCLADGGNIFITDMTAILAKMRRNTVSAALMANSAAATGSGCAPPRALRKVAT